MRHLVAALVAACLVACAPAPTPMATPSPSLGPARSAPPSPARPLPIDDVYTWDEAPDTPELAAVMDAANPPAVMRAIAGLTYSTDYDITCWLAPAEFLAAGRGCCTAFARLWLEWATRHGSEAYLVAAWGTTPKDGDWAHAVAVFRWPADGPWIHASNEAVFMGDGQALAYPEHYGDPASPDRARRAAFVRAADEYFPASWNRLEAFTPNGQLLERLTADAPRR